MNDAKNPYAGYRYPAEVISHAVWLYFRFYKGFPGCQAKIDHDEKRGDSSFSELRNCRRASLAPGIESGADGRNYNRSLVRP